MAITINTDYFLVIHHRIDVKMSTMLLEIRSDQNVKLTQHFMSKLVAPKSKHYVYVYCIRCEISQVSNDYHKR